MKSADKKPAEFSNQFPRSKSYRFIKRSFDIVCSLLAMILLSPFFLIVSLIIKLSDRGPVFFRHKRTGRNGKDFYLVKFRSMKVNAEEMIKDFTPEQMKEYKENFKLENDPRITKIGKFLRKTSIDEIPQFYNIFIGDMSFVGPRPVTEEETEIFGSHRGMLLSVRPGLTGYWAAYGRGDLTGYRRRRAMEIYYVKNCSVWLDIKIIFKTVGTVITGSGSR